MTQFVDIAKDKLPMKDALESYGISVNRNGMCLCPFHSEKTPSCKVYSDSLHCFGCGEHHDIISFTKMYFNLDTQLDALKKLNDDFTLGLSLDKSQKPNKSEISEYVKRKTEKEQYAEWERDAWETLRDRFRLMREFKEKYAPKNPYDNIDSRFVTACHYLEYSEYILEEYMNTPFEERKQFEDEVDSAKEFLNLWLNYCPEIKPITNAKKKEEASAELLPKFTKKREEVSVDSLLKRRIV
ncbi:MAG: CHC2 zinc finger domain-containing protein [Oscillospiraceae bacterium]|nr:CHC2 zinc finger domain-containing protein [Oscillospiraceae bacterium]